jgi:hypothetical protein
LTPTPPPDNPTPQPRAFARGTGVLLQWLGILLFLSSCCISSTAGIWDPVQSRAQSIKQLQSQNPVGLTASEIFRDPHKTATALLFGFAPPLALALAVFGLGMQADKPHAPLAAFLTDLLLIIILTASGIAAWNAEHATALRLWQAFLTLLTLPLLVFIWKAWKQVQADPPPLNTGQITEQELQQYLAQSSPRHDHFH